MKGKARQVLFHVIFSSMVPCALLFQGGTAAAGCKSAWAEESIGYEELDCQLEEGTKKFHIPGMAVALVDSEEILFARTYGNCRDIDTPFIIGSLSKSFTALAVMQLAEEQKIDLDREISAYIDTSAYFVHGAEGDQITVRQLLNQTSGLGTYQRLGSARITDSYGRHQYANVNYGLLGKIIEAVSGKTYSEYMDEIIFGTLGLEHTAATLAQSREKGLIKGYRNFFGIPVAGEPDYPREHARSSVPAGYISSSVSDMAKYLQMYLRGGQGIVRADSLNTMLYDGVYVEDGGYSYGMGWILTEEFEEPVLCHSGLVENYMSYMLLLPERDLGMVFLINMNDYLVANQLVNQLRLNAIGLLLEKETQTVSGTPYLTGHFLLDGIYLALLAIAGYPAASLRKWKKRRRTKAGIAFDLARHGILPMVLIFLPWMVGVPIGLVWYFVKDLSMVLLGSAVLLLAVGIYKICFGIYSSRRDQGA